MVPTMNISDRGKRIKAAREAAGYTQEELAEAIRKRFEKFDVSITQQAIDRVERDEVSRFGYLPEVAMVCNTTAEWLAYGESPKGPDKSKLARVLRALFAEMRRVNRLPAPDKLADLAVIVYEDKEPQSTAPQNIQRLLGLIR